MKKLLALFLLLLSLVNIEKAKAYDFCVDGIYYNILSLDDLTVEVTYGDKEYRGAVIIPLTIEYMGRSLSVVSIGAKSFRYNINLVSVELPEGLQCIGQSAFARSSLREIIIPNSVTSLGSGAFEGCVLLEKVQIGPSLQRLGESVFGACYAIKSFVIEDGINTLDCTRDLVFNNDEKVIDWHDLYLGRNVLFDIIRTPLIYVEEVIIGKSVTQIDEHFRFTKKITSLCQEPPSLPSQDNATYLNVEVIVPQGTLSAYKSAESWKNFWNIHEEGSSTEEPNTCNMPTIEYIDGKLCISSTTPDSKCYYSIKDNDIVNNSIVDGDIELSATYTITAYATAESYERSSLSTATLCWIDGSFETDGIETPFASRKAAIITFENGIISVSGLEDGCPVQSFSIDGRIIGKSVAKDGIATLNAEKCAIIKIADKSIKIVETK